MNKTELIARIAEVSGLTKRDSETALNATLSAIQESDEKAYEETPQIQFSNGGRIGGKTKKGKRKKNWQ